MSTEIFDLEEYVETFYETCPDSLLEKAYSKIVFSIDKIILVEHAAAILDMFTDHVISNNLIKEEDIENMYEKINEIYSLIEHPDYVYDDIFQTLSDFDKERSKNCEGK